MNSIRLLAAGLAVTTVLPFLSPDADAATVRRHLRCAALPGLTLVTPFGGGGNYPLRITNQWAITIPANTTYSIRAGTRSFTIKRPAALPQGQSFTVPLGYQVSQCDATVPG